MQIKDIQLSDIKNGKNWLLDRIKTNIDEPMENWSILDADTFNPEDDVVYSGLIVINETNVHPIVMTKTVGHAEWWGDSCVFINGQWEQSGSNPAHRINEVYKQYVANPLPQDPSFLEEYDREELKARFQKWKERL